jgi:DGQHR domain-containing protein
MQQHQVETLNLPSQVMTSPAGTALDVVLSKSKEGIERLGVTTYEGLFTFKQLADHFQIEAPSDEMPEAYKKQRDVDARRIAGLKNYWINSEGPVFPSMTVFISTLNVKEKIVFGGHESVLVEISAEADRFIADGQGRTTFIKWLLGRSAADADYLDYTVNCKVIVTHTDTLSEPKAARIIRQLFSDYHCSVVKPNKSISKLFDTATPYAQFLNELLELPADDGLIVKDRIALHGKIKQGHLCTFDQFTSVIQRFLKVTPATANKQLSEPDNYSMSFELCRDFLSRVFAILPVKLLDSGEVTHEDAMFTKAIFLNAMGYVGRSLLDEMLVDEQVGWDKLAVLNIPLKSKSDPYWVKQKVTMVDDGSVKVIKGTDRRIGAIICRELRIYPCLELAA